MRRTKLPTFPTCVTNTIVLSSYFSIKSSVVIPLNSFITCMVVLKVVGRQVSGHALPSDSDVDVDERRNPESCAAEHTLWTYPNAVGDQPLPRI